MKKVWIANEVKILDDIEMIGNNLFDDLISYGKIIPNRLDEIRNMDHKKMDILLSKININNRSILKMVGKDNLQ